MGGRAIGRPAAWLALDPGWLWLRSERPLRLLSSGPGGDGTTTGRHVIGLYVDKGYRCDEPERDLAALADRLGIPDGEGWVGLMTGVALDRAAVVAHERDGLAVTAIATVGLGNVAAAGRAPTGGLYGPPPGTINLIVLASAPLTLAGAVNAATTATEAKALALMDGGVRTPAGEPASGTTSDAIVVAAPADGAAPLRYAGTATTLGYLIGRAVREAVASRLP